MPKSGPSLDALLERHVQQPTQTSSLPTTASTSSSKRRNLLFRKEKKKERKRQLKEQKERQAAVKEHTFEHVLHLWRLTDATFDNDLAAVTSSTVSHQQMGSFSPDCCFMALHISRSLGNMQSEGNFALGAEEHGWFQRAGKALSPRGLSFPVSFRLFCESPAVSSEETSSPGTTAASTGEGGHDLQPRQQQLYYHLYSLNGLHSSPYLRAATLTRSYELEMLINPSNPTSAATLRALFYDNSLTALGSGLSRSEDKHILQTSASFEGETSLSRYLALQGTRSKTGSSKGGGRRASIATLTSTSLRGRSLSSSSTSTTPSSTSSASSSKEKTSSTDKVKEKDKDKKKQKSGDADGEKDSKSKKTTPAGGSAFPGIRFRDDDSFIAEHSNVPVPVASVSATAGSPTTPNASSAYEVISSNSSSSSSSVVTPNGGSETPSTAFPGIRFHDLTTVVTQQQQQQKSTTSGSGSPSSSSSKTSSSDSCSESKSSKHRTSGTKIKSTECVPPTNNHLYSVLSAENPHKPDAERLQALWRSAAVFASLYEFSGTRQDTQIDSSERRKRPKRSSRSRSSGTSSSASAAASAESATPARKGFSLSLNSAGKPMGKGLSLAMLSMPNSATSSDEPGDEDEAAKLDSARTRLKIFDPLCSEIEKDVFLGSQTVAMNKQLLQEKGITHILNCAGVICDEYFPNDFQYKTLHLVDGKSEKIRALLYNVIEWLDRALSEDPNNKVFIHCQQGVSRSSSFTCAFLMWRNHAGYVEVSDHVKKRRDVCSPNAGFMYQLLEWWSHVSKPLEERDELLYRVSPHRDVDPNTICLRTCDETYDLDPRFPFILSTPACIYLWIRPECHPRLQLEAWLYVHRLQTYEGAADICVPVRPGAETATFWESLRRLSKESTSPKASDAQRERQVEIYDAEAALIPLLRALSENEEDDLADMADRYAASSEEELAVEEERHEIQAKAVSEEEQELSEPSSEMSTRDLHLLAFAHGTGSLTSAESSTISNKDPPNIESSQQDNECLDDQPIAPQQDTECLDDQPTAIAA
eukprot:CAMPEP_0174231090 /NCGR_PEP_ID=MMETSP0417-20130205/1706_1 /TAXON_ID=242541 /ORGANISM="Mayorella sp, Strain BSH-02190019" /LENGTH=1041 /DNA_ID=CAMNT_0015308911 /DNA_START=106 /DNA_END=3227 /DNA_ORIENTATION=-